MEKKRNEIRRKSRIVHPAQLFRRRMLTYWKYQLSVIQSVADWTVMLYILIPGLLLGAGLYMEQWTTPPPAWLELMPWQVAAAALLFMFSGHVLLFVEEGDMLFLRQQSRWMRGLMARGMIYSITVNTLKGLMFVMITLPFLYRGFGLDAWTLFSWGVLAAGSSWCTNLLIHNIRVRFRGFLKGLFSLLLRALSYVIFLAILMFLPGMPISAMVTGLLLMLTAVFLMRTRLSMVGTFTADVQEDARIRMRLTDKVLAQAVGKPPRTRSKSWLFRKSRRIYRSSAPDKRFAGAGVKAFLRNRENLLLYVQLTAAAIPAVLFPPGVVKVIVYGALMLLVSYLLHMKWTAFAEAEFSLVLPFSSAQQMSAGLLAVRTLMLLPALLISLAFALTLWPVGIGLLAAAPLALICSYSVPVLFSRPPQKRKD
ncbi:ABC transporter permease [Paenibacillus faecalis]|uniref:ABC transporter permease n=1 Tax=Paenibacillus faecalis TaxID=2079532 RepID=UPI00131A5EA0|nr:ABC transporter permease [Paenibacillus faecalis]